MSLESVIQAFTSAGFLRTDRPATVPLVIHGVPGSGKSSVLKTLLRSPDVAIRIVGPAYGDDLYTEGVINITHTVDPTTRIRILDEYQLAEPADTNAFNVLVGDPYQGQLRFTPHLVKDLSHRVPGPIAAWLRRQRYQISGDRPGHITVLDPFTLPTRHPALSGHVIHLGPISKQLCDEHSLPSHCARACSGREYSTVTIVAHSSEFENREDLYIAATRTRDRLFVLTDQPCQREPHELSPAT